MLTLESFAIAGAAAILGTTLMTLFEFPFYRRLGLTSILELHENQVLISKMKKRSTIPSKTDVSGVLSLHYLNGFLAGLFFPVFVLIVSPAKIPTPHFLWEGILYAALLWLLTLIPIHKPITGLSPFDHPLGKAPSIISLTGHLIYALTIAFLFFSLV